MNFSEQQPQSRTISDLDKGIAQSRADRGASSDALTVLENALGSAGPGRELDWLNTVAASLDAFLAAVDEQSATSRSSEGLLSQLTSREPRLSWRIDRLEREFDDIKSSARSLREQINPEIGNPHIDVTDIRNRIASLANRYRSQRSRVADLVYEAIDVDLGEGG
jgi:chromosome segregation ATPase